MEQTDKERFILGITGGVGAGKSRVLAILEQDYGFHVIQADEVAKRLMLPGMEGFRAVTACLGPSILKEDGSIDRAIMADMIFNDLDKRRKIDGLTHPLTLEAMLAEARSADSCRVVMEAAIPSKEFRDNCQEMWYVYTSRENRMARLKENRGYTEEKSQSIMRNQVPEETFRRFADAVIDNDGPLEETKVQIDMLLRGKAGQRNI